MIALLDNVQILVISKKLVNMLLSAGFITSLWLGVTQWIILTRLVTSLLVVIILRNIRFVTVTILLRQGRIQSLERGGGTLLKKVEEQKKKKKGHNNNS